MILTSKMERYTIMKKAIAIGLMSAAAAFICGKTLAADMPVRGIQPRAVETYNYWDGLYLGINGGFATGKINSADFSSDTATGFLGGLQVGANKQLGNVVIGLVTDIDIGSVEKSGNKLAWLGTTRGKFGFLVTPSFLVYGTGGVAYGGINIGTTNDIIPNGFKVPTVGWAVGGGVEFALTSNIGLGAEYLHVKLDGPSDAVTQTNAEGDIFRGVLNYRF